MKKLTLLAAALFSITVLRAQWVNDPQGNTLIAYTSGDAGEILLSTDEVSGDTYMQWCAMASNGWSVFLQRLNVEGVPQWGDDGIRIEEQSFNAFSEGTSMTATTNQAVVSCFANTSGECIAIMLDAEGVFKWGKQGISVFDFPSGRSCSRTEVLAGNGGGVWVLASDNHDTYLRFIDANGYLDQPTVISDTEKNCVHGKLLRRSGNSVFVVYEKELSSSPNTIEKELWVTGYNQNGISVSPAAQLMSTQTYDGTYSHEALSDGLGGGYAFIPHSDANNAFNTYVFHFNFEGVSTINDLGGIPVHSDDPDNLYVNANGTVHPLSHDLILAYCQTDALTQEENKLCVNRINATGERVWDDGIMIENEPLLKPETIKVDAFEIGNGFAVTYSFGRYENDNSNIIAQGLDVSGSMLWNTDLSEDLYQRNLCKVSSGFHFDQDIIVWAKVGENKIYGQNIQPDGNMGNTFASAPCSSPGNFTGEPYYDEASQSTGVKLYWTEPDEQPDHYNLYLWLAGSSTPYVTQIDGGETTHFERIDDEVTVLCQLTAVFDWCESTPALTPDGLEWLRIEVLEVPEIEDDFIVSILQVFNLNGQSLKDAQLDNLRPGIYIVQGLNESGKLINKKILISQDIINQ